MQSSSPAKSWHITFQLYTTLRPVIAPIMPLKLFYYSLKYLHFCHHSWVVHFSWGFSHMVMSQPWFHQKHEEWSRPPQVTFLFTPTQGTILRVSMPPHFLKWYDNSRPTLDVFYVALPKEGGSGLALIFSFNLHLGTSFTWTPKINTCRHPVGISPCVFLLLPSLFPLL